MEVFVGISCRYHVTPAAEKGGNGVLLIDSGNNRSFST